MKASWICLGKSIFSGTFLGDFIFLKVLKYLFLIFIGVLENLLFVCDSEFHSFGLKVAYGEEEKITITINTVVLTIVQKYYFAIVPFKSRYSL